MKELTVLMPVYNTNVAWLSEAIDSVLKQTYSNFDFLIIDDGSSHQNVWPCLESFAKKDSRIKLVKNEQNLGLVATLNKGLNLIESTWVARMDSDDICAPDRFEKQMDFLKANPQVAVVGTNGRYIETGKIYSRKRIPASHSEIAAALPFSCCFIHPSMIINREKILEIGGYPDVERAEDNALWLKVLFETNHHLANLTESLIHIRKGENVTLAYRKKVPASGVVLRTMVSNYLGMNSLPAVWDDSNTDCEAKIESIKLVKDALIKRFPYACPSLLNKELLRYAVKAIKRCENISLNTRLKLILMSVQIIICDIKFKLS